jgi:hypothetical protein
MSSDGSEDDTTILLRKQGISEDSIKKFKAGKNRIRGRKILNNSCTRCSKVTVNALRKGFIFSSSFNQLLSSSDGCRLCRLVALSLRNILPEIDEKLSYHLNECATTHVAVKFDDQGGTDIDCKDAWRVDSFATTSVLESFELFMSPRPDGIIRVEARISQNKGASSKKQQLCDIKSFMRIYTTDGKYH